MAKQSEVIGILSAHFEAHGWPLYVDQEKLNQRSRIKDDESSQDVVIVEIERHRPTLGASYVRGLPMTAFETYYMRYAVNMVGAMVQELPERYGKCEVDIDGLIEEMLSVVSFDPSIEALSDAYRISENVSHDEQEVANLRETEEFITSFADGFDDLFTLKLDLYEPLEGERKEELKAAYNEVLNRRLLEIAGNLWGQRDD